MLKNRNMKDNHNTNRKMNREARLSVVYLTVVFLPGIEVAFSLKAMDSLSCFFSKH